MSNHKFDRRKFLCASAVLGTAGVIGLASCGGKKSTVTPLKNVGDYYSPELPDKAADGKELKVGLVGCGGRGTGALENLLEAADGITVTAYGDVFADRLESCRATIKKNWNQDVPDENCFVGFDAYKNVIDMVDMVILTTPPNFRPYHFQYAAEKGVHAFLEKPIFVDPKGYRTCMAAAKVAEAKGLCVITGTQRRHQRPYVEANKQIQAGIIGNITGGNVYWNQNMLWYRERQAGWSDMEWNIRDWVNWKWLSGDHIVEQHVHNIDVFTWMSGMKPLKATSFGARHRRVTGDQYDMFSTDFEFENGVHLHSMCRQIDGTDTSVHEEIRGTKGYWNSETQEIRDYQGNLLWKYDEEAAQAAFTQHNPYVLEHVDWVNHIRRGEMHDEAPQTAVSTLAAVMARESAYTGKVMEWDEISASPLDYMPEELKLGPLDLNKYGVAIPGEGEQK